MPPEFIRLHRGLVVRLSEVMKVQWYKRTSDIIDDSVEVTMENGEVISITKPDEIDSACKLFGIDRSK